MFGSPEEIAIRSKIGPKLKEVENLLADASEQAARMGHNAPPDEAASLTKEIAELRMVVSGLNRQLERSRSDLVTVVNHTLELQRIASAAATPVTSLTQIAAGKAAETFGATIGHGTAIATLYLAAQLVPALQAVIHLIASWLAEIITGL